MLIELKVSNTVFVFSINFKLPVTSSHTTQGTAPQRLCLTSLEDSLYQEKRMGGNNAPLFPSLVRNGKCSPGTNQCTSALLSSTEWHHSNDTVLEERKINNS